MEIIVKKEEECMTDWTSIIGHKEHKSFVKEEDIECNVLSETVFVDVNEDSKYFQNFLNENDTLLQKHSPDQENDLYGHGETIINNDQGSKIIENKKSEMTNILPSVKEEEEQLCDTGFKETEVIPLPTCKAQHEAIRKCKFCDYATNSKSNLNDHIQTNHKLKNLNCEFCDYKTINSSHLKRHINCIHIKEKNFDCQYCKFSTYNSYNLKRHVDCVHHKVRNHKCQFCNYSTSNISNLKHHVNSIHHKVKSHVCSHCKYSTNNLAHLKRHNVRVHQ